MIYAQKSDLIDRFGLVELTQLTDRKNVPAETFERLSPLSIYRTTSPRRRPTPLREREEKAKTCCLASS